MSKSLKQKRNNSSFNLLNKRNKSFDSDREINILRIENLTKKAIIIDYEKNNKKFKSKIKELKIQNNKYKDINKSNEIVIHELKLEIEKYKTKIQEINLVKKENELLTLSLNNLKIDEVSHTDILNKNFYTNYIS